MVTMLLAVVSLDYAGASVSTVSAAIKTNHTDSIKTANIRIPFDFIQNRGQQDPSVLYYHSSAVSQTFFKRDSISMRISKPVAAQRGDEILPARGSRGPSVRTEEEIRWSPVGAKSSAVVGGLNRLPGNVNYLRGSSSLLNIPRFQRVSYTGLYDGIDVVFYGNDSQLEYDVILKPGADPHQLRFALRGAQAVKIDPAGDLLIQLKEGTVTQHKPLLFQQRKGALVGVQGSFRILAQKKNDVVFGFEVGKYDESLPLTIDPIINYSTYFGGSADEFFRDSTRIDSQGNIYLMGATLSADFPTVNPLQGVLKGAQDVFVTKLSPDASTVIWSTYLGGSGDEFLFGEAIDSNDRLWITGSTDSTDFPTQGAFQPTNAGGAVDGFLTRLSPDGTSLEYSTYLGGTGDEQTATPQFDSTGKVILTGFTTSPDFPTTVGAFGTTLDGSQDVFVTKFSLDGSTLEYSTYIGGSATEFIFALAIDDSGAAYLFGGTSSIDFPVINALQPNFGGGNFDTFLLKVDPTGATLAFSTFFGGSGDEFPSGIKLTASGILMSGRTFSTNFPVQDALQASLAGDQDGFLSKISTDGSTLLYSTYLGGTGADRIREFLLDGSGNYWVTGITASTDFPTQNPIQGAFGGGLFDSYASEISADGASLLFSTYLGGSDDDQANTLNSDASGQIYVTGLTKSKDFPIARPIQSVNAGGFDSFIVRLSDAFSETFSDASADGWIFTGGTWNVVPVAAGFALSGTVVGKADALAPQIIEGAGSVEADIQIQNAQTTASLLGWLKNKKDLVELQISEKKDRLLLKQKSKGHGSAKAKASMTIDLNTTHHFRLVSDGQQIQLFVDNSATPTVTIQAVSPPSGSIGFRLKGGGSTTAQASITNILAE